MKKCVVVLSGGMDSTVTLLYALKNYDDVSVISFYYKQKQSYELELAKKTVDSLGIKNYQIIDISFLGDICQHSSSNIINSNVKMTLHEDITHKMQPSTYIPNRNMVMLSIAVSFAEANKCSDVLFGFIQTSDVYGCYDTTDKYLSHINNALNLNNGHIVNVISPFNNLSKADEIQYLMDNYGNLDYLKNTITCYSPINNVSCGKCISCVDRLKAFNKLGLKDVIEYL